MQNINDEEFGEILDSAIANVPMPYRDRLENIAFLIEDEPTVEQRARLNLGVGQTLLGLYEGMPLPARGGRDKILPDKITIFKKPLLEVSRSMSELKENVGRTVWHEVAHYFGLNHEQIHGLENKSNNT